MVIEHIIAGNSIPHNEGAIPLTKESFDIKEPQKRSSDYSKTITIPENKVVNQIFEHAFDVNVMFQTFDPNKKTSYQIVQDGVTLMDGYCRLMDIVLTDGKIVYKIQATGAVGNIYELIKDKYIADLAWGGFDHTYNYLAITNSWVAGTGNGYFYPMIDKGGRASYDDWAVTDFQPVVYVREIITKIFDNAGFTLVSAFFDTTLFRSLSLMSLDNTLVRGNAAIKQRQYNVRRLTTSQNTIQCQNIGTGAASLADSSRLIFNSSAPSPYYNTSTNEYSTTTGYFTSDESETYKMQGSANFDLNYTNNFALVTDALDDVYTNYPSTAELTVKLWIVEKNAGGYTKIAFSEINFTSEFLAQWNVGTGTQSITSISKSFSFGQFNSVSGAEYMISAGDISIRYASSSYGSIATTSFSLDLNVASETSSTLLSTNLREGETLDISKALPKMKQSELLNAMVKRFNLYIEYTENNEVIIEPRDDYFTDESIDTSAMVDRAKDYVIKPLGALTAREYIFTDLEDKDTVNTEYQDSFDESYSYYSFDIDNDFTTEVKTISTVIAASPLQSQSVNNDRVITSAQFVGSNGFKSETAGKPRLLYVGGLLPTVKSWNLNAQSPTVATFAYTNYPYAGHLDNPYTPTFDLNWGVPKRLFYDFSYTGGNVINYPNSNCFNLFWGNNIREITDKDSKLLECYIGLRPIDYHNFTFRKRYYIDGSYWRLLKIEDYDVTSGQTTKCIFIKVVAQTAFVGTVDAAEGGIGTFDNGDILPRYQGNVEVVNPTTFINTPIKDVFTGEVYTNNLYVDNSLNIVLPTAVLEGMTGDLPILPTLAANEFYEITRGYIRLNGLAATTGYKVDLVSDTLGYSFAEIPAAFFNTDNNTGLMSISSVAPTILPFGEGAFLTSATNMEMPSGTTTLSIQLVYRVIKI
jgi:hypothetical protein